MRIPTFRRTRPTLEELEDIRTHRTVGLRRVIAVAGIIFIAFVAFVASMLVLPSMQELQSLRQEKERYTHLLERARLEEKRAHDAYIWSADSEYFEQIARDRANMAKDGETVIRFPSAEQPAKSKRD